MPPPMIRCSVDRTHLAPPWGTPLIQRRPLVRAFRTSSGSCSGRAHGGHGHHGHQRSSAINRGAPAPRTPRKLKMKPFAKGIPPMAGPTNGRDASAGPV